MHACPLLLLFCPQAEAIASACQAAVVTAAGMEDELQHKLEQLEQDTQQVRCCCTLGTHVLVPRGTEQL